MRALVLVGLLVSTDARADCFGVSFAPRGATVVGRVAAIEWGAPIVVRCPSGQARCFEAALATSHAPTHVRIVLEGVEHRDARGAKYKLARVVLDGILPRRVGECQPDLIAKGQIRELEVQPRTSAPWRITSLR